jgi:hypothetical protein
MLNIARNIGLDDTVNAANWQELARWLLRSRLDPESRKELAAKEAEEESGVAAIDRDDQRYASLPPTLRLCGRVLSLLMRRKEAEAAFNEPVDPVEMEMPSYFTVVKDPMVLNIVRERLHAGFYTPGTTAAPTAECVLPFPAFCVLSSSPMCP